MPDQLHQPPVAGREPPREHERGGGGDRLSALREQCADRALGLGIGGVDPPRGPQLDQCGIVLAPGREQHAEVLVRVREPGFGAGGLPQRRDRAIALPQRSIDHRQIVEKLAVSTFDPHRGLVCGGGRRQIAAVLVGLREHPPVAAPERPLERNHGDERGEQRRRE